MTETSTNPRKMESIDRDGFQVGAAYQRHLCDAEAVLSVFLSFNSHQSINQMKV